MSRGARVRSVVARANKKLTIKGAAILLASSTLLSSLLGLYRERLLNGMYYDSYKVGIDAYTVAFTIPDFMFFVLVSGALSVSFIPVFNQRLATGNKKSAWELSSSMINFLAVVTLVASILIIIFAEPLVSNIVAPGLSESGRSLAVSMMRVIAVNPFLFAIATVIASMQQAIGRFTFYALAPTIYNIGIIIGALFFTQGINIFGWQVFEGGIMGVALGVVLGSILQLIVSSVGLLGLGFDYQFKISWKNKGFRKVLRLLPARSLDQGIDYLNGLVETNLASHMASGTIRAYQNASTLSMVPVNLIGVAISNAAFPQMTERLSEGREDLFRKELQSMIRVIVWLALPVAVVTYFGRGYIVSFIKNGGDLLMAGLLGALVIALLFRTIYHIAARSFYAQQDTKTPLYISIFSITLNVALAIYLTATWPKTQNPAYGLAWAQSITAVVEVAILFFIMGRRIPRLFDRAFVKGITKMVYASLLTMIVSYVCVLIFPLQSDDQRLFATIPKFAVIAMTSLAAYVLFSRWFHLPEATPVIKKAKQIMFGRRK
ncbi:MAG: murein biosynthesis integral membrane protein MurJ [Candidatus Saccharimonas sp.]